VFLYESHMLFSFLKKLLLSTFSIIFVTSCSESNPETDYQKCLEIENLYNSNPESNEKYEDVKKALTVFFKKHINSKFAQKVFAESRWVRRLEKQQLEEIIVKVKDVEFKTSESYNNIVDRLKYMKLSEVGNQYINFISKDTIGTVTELSEYVGKGKYILLDFWASWCPDCRKEMPELIELYNIYKGDKFEIVGYSLDRNLDAWKKGINNLKINWPQLSDLDYWTSQGVKFYAVQWIPTTILFSPDGKIIERGMSISALKDKLHELIN